MVVNDQYGSPTSCNLISKVLNKIIFDKNWYNIAKFVIKYSKKKIKKNSSTLEATNSKKFKTIAKRPKNTFTRANLGRKCLAVGFRHPIDCRLRGGRALITHAGIAKLAQWVGVFATAAGI